MRLPPGEGVAGWIVERGLPLIVEDVSADRRFSKRIDRLTGFETKSIIGVPLMTDRKVFGAIELINKLEGGKFTSLELRILTAVADFAAIALEKAYYFRALRKMAETDLLTGVYNRDAFERLFREQMEICERSCRPFSVLMIDIDQFKKIVDVHGRAVGDELLKRLAGLLESCVRRTDMVFRFGGDEFVVMLPGALRGQARKVRWRIVERIDRLLCAEQVPDFSVSIGLHTMESGEDSYLVELLNSDLQGEKHGKFSLDPGDIFENFHEMLRDERSLRPPRSERFGR
jgi:diguanylate cyclase (GGDEF)-like protein